MQITTVLNCHPNRNVVEDAAFEALENGWPFSSLASGQVRYQGTNPDKKLHKAINKMVLDTMLTDPRI